MKSFFIVAASWVTLNTGAAPGQSEYLNVVRQIQQDSGVEWDVTVPPQGSGTSQMAMEEGGALFQLWTLKLATQEPFLLDQKLVGAYIPKAAVVIRTGDPYPGIPRTRVDQPYEIELTVEGLLAGADLPSAARQVLIQQEGRTYPEGSYAMPPGDADEEWPVLFQGFHSNNGTVVFQVPGTRLSAPDLTRLAGEERIRVHALPDHEVQQSQIAAATLQIWPLAEAAIGNLEARSYALSPPEAVISLTRLYPGSTSWVQIYKGSQSLGKQGDVIQDTTVILENEVVPQNRVVRIRDWGRYLTSPGEWTIEVITETPFGVERLNHLTFSVQQVLRIRSLLTTAEIPGEQP